MGARETRAKETSRVHVGEMADLVDEHRAAVAARVMAGTEHEVIDEKLAAAIEKVDQAGLALRSFELVVLLDPHHRLAPPLGSQRVARPRGCLFLGKKALMRRLPLGRRYDCR
jgi:hypothetical protein